MCETKCPSSQSYGLQLSPAQLLALFVPTYADKRVAQVDLNQEAQVAMNLTEYKTIDPRLFSDATFCSTFVEQLHRRRGIDASWGGYLEDRAFIWQGTYLGGTERTLHLGVDFNVPAGCQVTTPFDGAVVLCDDDTPLPFGWGPRVFIERHERLQSGAQERFVYIFAHVTQITVREGDRVKVGQHIASIGSPPSNGNWFPHLHLQKVRGDIFDYYRTTDLRQLDGYGLRSEADTLPEDFPNPLSAII